jgi:hypothetical protein
MIYPLDDCDLETKFHPNILAFSWNSLSHVPMMPYVWHGGQNLDLEFHMSHFSLEENCICCRSQTLKLGYEHGCQGGLGWNCFFL